MAAAAHPRFLVGPASSGAIAFPMATVAGLSLAEATPSVQRAGVAVTPLLHQQRSAVDDQTPGATRAIEMRLGLQASGGRQGDAQKAIEQLWSAIGTSKIHLWIVDDDQYDTLTLTNNETAGAAHVFEYTAPAKTWFANGDFLFLPNNGGGSDDEVVVVTAKTDGTPSFTATAAFAHGSGSVVYRVAACYPSAVLQSIRPSAIPLGLGSLVLSWITGEVPLFGTSLPT